MAIAPGTRLGPYEIIAPLGAGGMGEVWRGRDTRLDRAVAIKILPAEFANDAQLKLRLEREARTISQLNHPHICTLYDVGDSFLVMELLEGESLAERLGRGPLPIPETIRYGVQIAEALDRAHRAGIIHRDLKPGNVIITRSGAKLLDFGLAKSVAIVGGDVATVHKALTEEGTILGTFQYMAPEQLEGEEADARTDIFALGALLYEMATGKRAFDGKTKTSLIAAIVGAQPRPISEIQPLTPPAFEHVVQKCLAKDRDARWQSAHDIAEELRWIGEAGSQAGVPAPVVKRRQRVRAIALLAALVLAVAAGVFSARALHLFQTPPREYRLTVPTFDAEYRGVSTVAISPDGRTLYFLGITADNKRVVFKRAMNDFRATQIEGAVNLGGFGFTITPDGRNLIIAMPAGVYKSISVDGGAAVVVGVAESGGAPAAGPDGTILVGSGNLDTPIRRVTPNRTEAIFTLDKANGEVGQCYPTFLPARKSFWLLREPPRFLFLSVSRDVARAAVRFTLCAATLGSKEIKRIGEVPSRVEYGGGHLFFVRDGTLMAQPFDVDRLEFTGDAVPVMSDVPWNSRSALSNFSVSEQGTIVCPRAVAAAHFVWVDATGKKLGTFGNSFALSGGIGPQPLAVSRQRDRVVLAVNDHRAGLASIWIQGVTRNTITRATFDPAEERNPVVSPDGSRVFFASDAASAGWDIYEAPLDASEPPKLLVSAPNAQIPDDISPDGRFLLYMSNQNQTATKQDLWILPLTGDRKPYPFLATPAQDHNGVFSPDGKWIAYSSDLTGSEEVYVRPFPGPGAARPVSVERGASPRFSADGRTIYFLGGNGKVMAAGFRDGVVDEPKELFELSDRIATYEPVGDRFLMVLTNDLDASPPARVIVNWRPPHQ